MDASDVLTKKPAFDGETTHARSRKEALKKFKDWMFMHLANRLPLAWALKAFNVRVSERLSKRASFLTSKSGILFRGKLEARVSSGLQALLKGDLGFVVRCALRVFEGRKQGCSAWRF